MKKVLAAFLVIGIILCVLLYYGGQYPDKIKEFLTPEEPNGEILNNFESITKEEAMAYINDNSFVNEILNKQGEEVLNVSKYIKNLPNKSKLFILTKEETFTRKELESKALNTFGIEDKITHENIICPYDDISLYNYDSNTGIYTYNYEHGGHGGDSIIVHNHFINIKEENNTYMLSVSRFYADGELDNVDSKAYSNYIDYKNRTENYLFDVYAIYGDTIYVDYNKNFINYFEENYNTFEDKLKTYKFTMRKENNIITVLKYEIN